MTFSDAEYRTKTNEARMQLALLPEHDKVCSFDEVAGIVESLPAALASATPDQVKQLLSMLVAEVTTRDRAVAGDKAQARGAAVLADNGGGFGLGAPGRIRTADASLRTAALYPLSYGGAGQS